MKTVLVTGARGFVGTAMCRCLLHRGYHVRAAVREPVFIQEHPNLETYVAGDLRSFQAWPQLLHRVDAVLHLVARTHIVDDFGCGVEEAYRRVNVGVTQRMAEAAIRARVEHIVFMSSIKAVGNGASQPYSETTTCLPEDSYGISKYEAEQVLVATLKNADCDYTILRPPLVYGEGVRGNFLRLMQLVRRGIPVPAVSNSRSLVHVDSLVDASVCCLGSAASRNQIFHIADPNPLSTAELVRHIAKGLRRTPLLIHLPQRLARQVGMVLGKGEQMKRLAGSLTVEAQKITEQIGWQSLVDTREGVARTARAYLQSPWPGPDIAGYPKVA